MGCMYIKICLVESSICFVSPHTLHLYQYHKSTNQRVQHHVEESFGLGGHAVYPSKHLAVDVVER
jgi:hypothetical protein